MALAVVLEEQPVVTDAKGEQQGFVNSVFKASEEQHGRIFNIALFLLY
jgi:hypothetical protein